MVGGALLPLSPLTARHWYFIIQNFEQLVLALKNRVCLEIFQIHCIEIFYIFQDFWATCACPENRICPGKFHCREYTFCIEDFWAICACPENQSLSWIHCMEYIFFNIQNFEQLALALKNRVSPKIFHCIEIFYIFSGFLSNLRLPWKQSVPWKTEFAVKNFAVLKYFLSFMIL